MARTYTRTHTRFFAEEELDKLAELVEVIAADWQSRATYIDTDVREAGNRRVELLRHAVALAAEWAD